MATQRSAAVTLSDIARHTGVSKVTVSAVLNRRGSNVRVSEATRDRILLVAREMGYHPNALARGLTRRRTDTLALVLHSPATFAVGSGFTAELMHGVVEAVNALDYDLMLHTRPNKDPEREALALTDGRVDGVLLLRDRDDPLAGRLEERGFPNVSIFSRPDTPGTWSVDADNVAGGRLGIQYLLSLGHRRIAFVGGPERSAAACDRHEGVRVALAEAGLPGEPFRFCRLGHAGNDFGPLLAWFAPEVPASERPTALFLWSDDVARQAITVLREAYGLRVPEDVSVLGYDNIETICEHSVPHLSSIRQPIYDIAARGVHTLVERIGHASSDSDAPPPAERQTFPPALVERHSCGPAPPLARA